MKKRILSFVLAAVLLGLMPISGFGVSAYAASETSDGYTRLYGGDRYETAIEISKLERNSAENVILASGLNFPDALAGGPLAHMLDAPVLLTRGTSANIESNVLDRISQLSAKNIYILGGESAVSSGVFNQLKDLGYHVDRLFGKDRFETATAIANKMDELRGCPPEFIFVADGLNYPDALSASPAAAIKKVPILFTPSNQAGLRATTANYASSCGAETAVLLGGTAVVKPDAAASLAGLGLASSRVSGNDRYETSAAIYNAYKSIFGGNNAVIATGLNFPDALAGGVLAAKLSAPLFLVRDTSASSSAANAGLADLAPNNTYLLGSVTIPVKSDYVPSDLTEMRAVWVGYPDLAATGVTPASLDQIVATASACKMNTIIFHVRPFGDALYRSDLFPWSHFVTGTQGTAPANGFDPLDYIINRAHEAGIQVHAWINPLRIQVGYNPPALSAHNPYNIYRTDGNPLTDDYVIDYNNGKYYNPGKEAVRNLLIGGVAEIVQNYAVDGIHFDDYFYPANDQSFNDSIAYNEYLISGGGSNLITWRTDNINKLVKGCYDRIKSIRPQCVFGISPQGNIGNCERMGADVRSWCSESGYIDYICPQLYWTFNHPTAPFESILTTWRGMTTSSSVRFYVGLALYRAGTTTEGQNWLLADNIISSQILRMRQPDIHADGFMLYSYSYLTGAQTKNEMANIMSIL